MKESLNSYYQKLKDKFYICKTAELLHEECEPGLLIEIFSDTESPLNSKYITSRMVEHLILKVSNNLTMSY